ncbi:SseB family protein [Rothia sp. LK2588]|uniref:SseB family protein n=1 Tax=Rothia sp. LK2588 TaxID=3114369 RepID=UPI0034CFE63C
MSYTPRYTPEQRPAMIAEALNNIGSWLLGTVKAEDGWNELVLDIKPLTDAVFIRITESRDESDYVGSTGPLRSESAVIPEIEKLQHAAYDEQEGTWFTATVVIAAKNWPHPEFQIGAGYNRLDEPEDWEGEGRLTARELRVHLEQFPRDEAHIPAWAQQRLSGRRRAGEPDAAAQSPEFRDPGEASNSYLKAALDAVTSGQRIDAEVVNVLRASLGGEILLDITDSERADDGETIVELRYKVLRLVNGLRALCVYSAAEHAEAHFEEHEGYAGPELLSELTMKVYLDFMNDESCDLIVIDPGTAHETFLEKAQVQWVLSTPMNDAAKRALLAGNMQLLLAALAAPGATLLMGVRPGTDAPVFVPAPAGAEPETMLVFTSAAEVATLDSNLHVRSAPALDILKFADQLGATGVRINSASPSATLPIAQIRELVALIESAQRSDSTQAN